MPSYYVSLQKHYNPWNTPDVLALIHTLKAKFPTDDMLTVIPMGGAMRGFYEVILTETPDEADQVLPVMVNKQLIELPLVPEKQFMAGRKGFSGDSTNIRAEGVLITLYNCTKGPLSKLSNELFDKVLSEHGEVTRLTQFQQHRGSSVFNGNRFCVLKPNGTIPDRITLNHPTQQGTLNVSLGYKGKTKMCGRCLTRHAGICAELEEFFAVREAREQMTIDTKIVSDSTLRHADGTGLSADVVCMSGGRIGNIGHMIIDEPSMKSAKNIIMVAGQNDIHRDNESVETFKEIITKSLDFVQQVTFSSHKLTVVQPLLPADTTAIRKEKAEVLHEICLKLQTNPTLPMQYLHSLDPVEMDGIHPTVSGTSGLLNSIHKHISIIHKEKYITDTKLYRGVQSAFRYGCLYCPVYLELDERFICGKCRPVTEDDPPDRQSSSTEKSPLSSSADNNMSIDERQSRKRNKSGDSPPDTPTKFALIQNGDKKVVDDISK